jgi:hypothetical protein
VDKTSPLKFGGQYTVWVSSLEMGTTGSAETGLRNEVKECPSVYISKRKGSCQYMEVFSQVVGWSCLPKTSDFLHGRAGQGMNIDVHSCNHKFKFVHENIFLFDFWATYIHHKEKEKNEIGKRQRSSSHKVYQNNSTTQWQVSSICYLNGATFLNFDSLPSPPTRSSKFLNVFDNIQSLDNFSEDNMFPIKPACHDLITSIHIWKGVRYSGDEELGTISVGAGVCHGEETGFSMLQFEVFVCEFLTIDGFSTGTAVKLDD